MAERTAPSPSYFIRSPPGFSCLHNYQITASIHINTIFTLSSSSSSPSTIIDPTSSNSLYSNTVSFLLLSSWSSRLICRAIRSQRITIHSTPSSSVSSSLAMFSHYLLDRFPMFNDTVFVHSIHLSMWMILTIHPSIQQLADQSSPTFMWRR